MKKTFIVTWMTICLLLGFSACQEEMPPAILNQSEVTFGEKLASISADAANPNIFFIGTEDGTVFVYHADNSHIDTLYTQFDRIYRVVRDIADPSVFWVGTRNMGMFRCKLLEDSLHSEMQYTIPAKNKEKKYSAYDINIQKSGVYVATSHGVYVVKEEACPMMTPLHVVPDKNDSSCLTPVVYDCFILGDNGKLYCGGKNEIIEIAIGQNNTIKTCLTGDLRSFVLRDGCIYALSDGLLRVYDFKKEEEYPSIKLPHPAQLYFYDPMEGVNYFISDNHIQLVKDSLIREPGEYKDIILQGKSTRMSTCHHIIMDDPLRQQSLLLTRNSIHRIGHHQDVFNSVGKVDYACVDGTNIYYLVGTFLYKQDTADPKESMKAFLCKDIGRDVSFMTVKDDVLYYVDNHHKAFRAELHSSFLYNSLWPGDEDIKPELENDVTAIGKNQQGVFVGIRDGFRNIEAARDTILLSDINPFVTAISQARDGSLILSTLNEGIFRQNKNKFVSITNTDSIQFIRDVIVDNKDMIWFLTNRHVYHQQENGEFKAEYDAHGYSRLLLIGEQAYGISEHGIYCFSNNTDYLVDVAFTPSACVVMNDKLYCGSSNGVYVIDNNHSGNQTVEFIDAFKPFSRSNIIIFLVILFAIIVGLWAYDRYRLSRYSIISHKNDLIRRISALQIAYDFLSAQSIETMENLSKEVIQINESGRKKALIELQRLSKETQELTASIPFELRPLLTKTVEKIKKEKPHEWESFVKLSDEAIASHNISQIAIQLKKNTNLLEEIKDTQKKLDEYTAMFDYSLMKIYAIQIENITSKVKEIAISEEMDAAQKVSEIEEVVKKLIADEGHPDTIAYLRGQQKKAEKLKGDMPEGLVSSLCEDYETHLKETCELNSLTDTVTFLNKVLLTNQRLYAFQKLIDIRKNVKETFGRKKEIEKERVAEKKNGVLDPWKEEKRWKEEDELKKDIKRVPERIQKHVEHFYQCIQQSKDWELLEEMQLKTNNQEGIIFPLMLIIPKELLSFDHYSELVDGNQKSLYRAKTKLEEMYEPIAEKIKEYAKDNPSSIEVLIFSVFH